jgi:hypothetical protein
MTMWKRWGEIMKGCEYFAFIDQGLARCKHEGGKGWCKLEHCPRMEEKV